MKRFFSLYCMLAIAAYTLAQAPNNTGIYYSDADGKKGTELKTALFNIISNHKQLSYNGLWEAFKETDKRADGKVWDMYSNITNYTFGTDQGKSYKKEGDSYNREHSFPKSWFNDSYPMYTDLVHLIPADGYVNGMRSNYPFGETYSPTYMSNGGFSKLGPSSVAGYSGKVFEPNDDYKGDFARIYFYMATCYENKVANWNCDMLDGSKTTVFSSWALDMLMDWAAKDPVSQKEIDRNNAVYDIQGNRNPFVDYPGLEQYIWGDKKDMAFSYDDYDATTPDPGTDPNPGTDPVEGDDIYMKVKSESDLTAGSSYLIVCESKGTAMSASGSDIRNCADVTISNDRIETEVNKAGKPYLFELGGSNGEYTLYDVTENVYLALTASENKLHKSGTVTDEVQWIITVSGNSTQIQNKARSDRYIQYNSSSPRFACYKGTQAAVALYKKATATGIGKSVQTDVRTVDVFTTAGILVRKGVESRNALKGLGKGIYIINKRKYIVR